mmetsp:Transcript_21557/g.19624  ORF Transcript_21557/g.19624 Transcript_21557/m.19624 type:complete len:221 (+) Transcript_21557:21-683(+)
MNKKEKSDIILDNNGNIIPNKLEKSLKEALEYDLNYKLTDNMKKRACKTASSYDEFKAMVDCAHLNKVNRKDIESLRQINSGWNNNKKIINNKPTSNANILYNEFKEEKKLDQMNKVNDLLINKKFRKPKTSLEFSRDFKRQIDFKQRVEYLNIVGLKDVQKHLRVESDSELFELIIESINQYDSTPDNAIDTFDKIIWLNMIKDIVNSNIVLSSIIKLN